MVRILTILLFSIFVQGHGQNQELFDRATALYNDGKYKEAAEDYFKILESGQHSAELYFNLGNTFYKLDSIAPSIYYYEKALLLKPNDTDFLNNLAFAQNMTLDAIESLPQTAFSKFWHNFSDFLSFDQWAYLAVFFMFGFVGLYIGFYYLTFSFQKRIAFIGSMASLALTLCSAVLAYITYQEFISERPAVVFAQQAPIRPEPNTRGEAVFTLHPGTKVEILDELGEWKKIQISDGKTGWVQSGQIKELKDF